MAVTIAPASVFQIETYEIEVKNCQRTSPRPSPQLLCQDASPIRLNYNSIQFQSLSIKLQNQTLIVIENHLYLLQLDSGFMTFSFPECSPLFTLNGDLV